jgi:hypothetical protein
VTRTDKIMQYTAIAIVVPLLILVAIVAGMVLVLVIVKLAGAL